MAQIVAEQKGRLARVDTPAQADIVPQPPDRLAPATSTPMKLWNALARPPVTALKEIKGGRLSGMTDVNPQWRYQAMTEHFGMCGVGWKYEIDKLWTEPGADGEVLGFAQVSVRVRLDGTWSDSIIGLGGNHLITKEKGGLHNNDECWKMAVTDALSAALKMLGVAADIYAGRWDGSKFKDEPQAAKPNEPKGYQDWLIDMEAVSAEGTDALKSAWAKSPPALRKHLTDTRPDSWEQLKKRAALAKVASGA